MMKLTILPLILLTVSTLCSAQPVDDLASEISQRLKERGENTATITCAFVQTRRLSMLEEDATASGRFYFKRDRGMRLEFDTPEGDLIVMDDSRFLINSMGRSNIVPLGAHPMLGILRDMFTASMTGDLSAMTANVQSTFERTEQGYRITLRLPNRKRREKVSAVVMTFDAKDMSLSCLRMEQSTGDYTQYDFFDKNFNLEVDDSKFVI